MTDALRVLLVAEEGAGLQTLNLLDRVGADVVGVISSTASDGGTTPIRTAAQKMDCPVWEPAQIKTGEIVPIVADVGIDLLINAHSLVILPADLLTLPRIGAFNLHPGPLPTYAGLSVPSWAIYRGESEHGVTVHWMTPTVDAGDIAYAATLPITPKETGLSLSLKCIKAGLPLVEQLLAAARTDPHSIPAITQRLEDRRYYRRGAPNAGRIDWTDDGSTIDRFVRASDYRPFPSPWGSPWTEYAGRRIGIVVARVTQEPATAPPGTIGTADTRGVLVASRTEWVRVERIADAEAVAPAATLLEEGNILGSTNEGGNPT